MSRKTTTFGDYIVVVVETGDLITKREGVKINWSAIGECDLKTATQFKLDLSQALLFALKEDIKLNISRGQKS